MNTRTKLGGGKKSNFSFKRTPINLLALLMLRSVNNSRPAACTSGNSDRHRK